MPPDRHKPVVVDEKRLAPLVGTRRERRAGRTRDEKLAARNTFTARREATQP